MNQKIVYRKIDLKASRFFLQLLGYTFLYTKIKFEDKLIHIIFIKKIIKK